MVGCENTPLSNIGKSQLSNARGACRVQFSRIISRFQLKEPDFLRWLPNFRSGQRIKAHPKPLAPKKILGFGHYAARGARLFKIAMPNKSIVSTPFRKTHHNGAETAKELRTGELEVDHLHPFAALLQEPTIGRRKFHPNNESAVHDSWTSRVAFEQ